MFKLFKPAALATASAAMLASAAPATAATGFDIAASAPMQIGVQTGSESWQQYRDRYRDGYRNRGYYSDRGYRGRTWRGRDGRYYCRRPNGTTGLLVGGAVGALLGRSIDGGYNRATGTILGAAGGALLGRSIDRDRTRCR